MMSSYLLEHGKPVYISEVDKRAKATLILDVDYLVRLIGNYPDLLIEYFYSREGISKFLNKLSTGLTAKLLSSHHSDTTLIDKLKTASMLSSIVFLLNCGQCIKAGIMYSRSKFSLNNFLGFISSIFLVFSWSVVRPSTGRICFIR